MKNSYWLMKSEPDVYSITDLERDGKTSWEGVRNYQARNFLRDKLKIDDEVYFYHSNAEPSGIAGIARICREGYPDPEQFNAGSRYYDKSSSREKPVWYCVDVEFVKKFKTVLALELLRKAKGLEKMSLLQKGQRLSVQPVTQIEREIILGLVGR